MNITAGNGADVIKKPDCENRVIAKFDDGTDFSKKLISLNGVFEVLD